MKLHKLTGTASDRSHESSSHLGNTPRNQERSFLRVWQHTTGSVVETEVGRTVNDDTLY